MAELSESEVAAKANEEANNVKCSFCGNETSCDACRKEPEKYKDFEHCCYDCYQKMGGNLPENVRDKTHVCVPPEKMQENFERFLNDMTQRAFTDLWNSEKKRLKDMSRQELSQASFFEGARFMFGLMQRMSQEPENKGEGQAAGKKEGQ